MKNRSQNSSQNNSQNNSKEKLDYKRLSRISNSRNGSRGGSKEFDFKMLGGDGGIYSGRADTLKTERSDRSDSSPEENNDSTCVVQIDLRFDKCNYNLSHSLLVSLEVANQEAEKSLAVIAAEKKAGINSEDDLPSILQKLYNNLNLEDENIIGVFQLIGKPNKKEAKYLANTTYLKVPASKPFLFGAGAFGRVRLARQVVGLKDPADFFAVKKVTLQKPEESDSSKVKKVEKLDPNKEARFLELVAKKTYKEGLPPIFLPITHSLVSENSKPNTIVAYQFMPFVNLGNGNDFREIFWSKANIHDCERVELRRYIVSKLFNLVTRLHRFQRCRIFHRDLKPSNYLLHFDGQLHIYLCDPGSAILFNRSGEIDEENSPNGDADDVHAPPENVVLQHANASECLFIFKGLSKQEIYELDEAWRFGLIYLSLVDDDLYNKFKATATIIAAENIEIRKFNRRNPKNKKPEIAYETCIEMFKPLYAEIEKLDLEDREKNLLQGFLHYDLHQREKLLGLNWDLSPPKSINRELCSFLLEGKYNPNILKSREHDVYNISLQFSFDKEYYPNLSHTLVIDVQIKNFSGNASEEALIKFKRREIDKNSNLTTILSKIHAILKPHEHTICIFQLLDSLNEEERRELAAQSQQGEVSLKNEGCLARQVIVSDTSKKFLLGKFLIARKIKQQEVNFLEYIKNKIKAEELSNVFIPQVYHLQIKSINNENTCYQFLPIAKRYDGTRFVEGFWSSMVSDVERIQLRHYILLNLLELVLKLTAHGFYPNFNLNSYVLDFHRQVTLHLYHLTSGINLNTMEEAANKNYSFGKNGGMYAPPESKFPQSCGRLTMQQRGELKVAWQFGLIYLSLIDKKIFNDFIALANKLKKQSRNIYRHNRSHSEKLRKLTYEDYIEGYATLYAGLMDRLDKFGIASEEKELLLGLLHYDFNQRKLLTQIQCQLKRPAGRAVQPIFTKIFKLTSPAHGLLFSASGSMNDFRKTISDDVPINISKRLRASTSTPSSPEGKFKSSSDIRHDKMSKDDTALTEGGLKALRKSLLSMLRSKKDDTPKERELSNISSSVIPAPNEVDKERESKTTNFKERKGTPNSLRRAKSQDDGMFHKQITGQSKRSSVILIPKTSSSGSTISSEGSNKTSTENSPRTASNSPSGSRGKIIGFLHHLGSSSGSTNVSPSSSKTPSPREAFPKTKTPPSPSKPGKGV